MARIERPIYPTINQSPRFSSTFDETTLRSPRYSGRRALGYVGRLPGSAVDTPGTAIENFVAPPPQSPSVATPVFPQNPATGPGEAPSPFSPDPFGLDPSETPAPVVSVDPNTGVFAPDTTVGPDTDDSGDAAGANNGAGPASDDSGDAAGANNGAGPASDDSGDAAGAATGPSGAAGPAGDDSGDAAGASGDAGPAGDDGGDAAGAAGPGDAGGDAGSGDAGSGDAGGDGGGDGGGGDGGGCFITEAVMAAGGAQDGGMELQTLRQFRDQAMMSNPVGQAMVAQYEAIAPIVVEAVSQRPDAMQIFAAIKQQFLDRAVMAIQQGDMEEAFHAYAEMMAYVTPFAVESQPGMGGDPDDRVQPGQEAVDDFGDMAAMGAYNPEMAGAAVGGVRMDDPMMNSGSPQVPGGAPSGAMMPPQEPAIGQFVRRY